MCVEDLTRSFFLFAFSGAKFVFSVGYPPLQDAAQFYWGRAEDFDIEPLTSMYSRMYQVSSERVCDINTLEDWMRAHVMYAKLMGITE
jgi:hypothetical protein